MALSDDFEILFLEGLVEKHPNYVDALIALAEVYTAQSLYEKGLTIDKRLAVLCPDDALVFYNLACSYSLLNHKDLALGSLVKAVKLGYDEWKYMQSDPDLKNLANEPQFKNLIARLRPKAPRDISKPM